MRIVRYVVVNRETEKREFLDCRYEKCEEYINNQENAEKYVITRQWRNF